MRLAPLLALVLIAAPAAAADLKLTTWNIAWLTTKPTGHPDLPRNVRARTSEDFALLRRYARRLSSDIIALQEVDGPEAAARVLDPEEWTVFFPDEADVQRTAVAVRRGLPARQNPDLAALDLYPRARYSLRRGVDVTVGEGTHAIRILSIHLKSGCRGAGDVGPECDILFRQGAILSDWVAARHAAGEAFAIAGDFNHHPQRGSAALPGFTWSEDLTRATAGRSNPCWDGRPFRDHILLGGAARDWLRPDSLRVLVYAEREPEWRNRLSDHCPVSVTLRLP